MEPNNQTKRAIIEGLIAQAENEKFSTVTMGGIWNEFGNAQKAEACAKAVMEVSQVITGLYKKLDSIPLE